MSNIQIINNSCTLTIADYKQKESHIWDHTWNFVIWAHNHHDHVYTNYCHVFFIVCYSMEILMLWWITYWKYMYLHLFVELHIPVVWLGQGSTAQGNCNKLCKSSFPSKSAVPSVFFKFILMQESHNRLFFLLIYFYLDTKWLI